MATDNPGAWYFSMSLSAISSRAADSLSVGSGSLAKIERVGRMVAAPAKPNCFKYARRVIALMLLVAVASPLLTLHLADLPRQSLRPSHPHPIAFALERRRMHVVRQ